MTRKAITPALGEVLLLIGLALGLMPALAGGGVTSWLVGTDDTQIRFDLVGGLPAIKSLHCKGDNHNWLAGSLPIVLMERVWIGEQLFPLAWRLEQVQESRQTGQLAFTFTNAEPRLVLRSIWRGRPGHGPVEHWVEIENLSNQIYDLAGRNFVQFKALVGLDDLGEHGSVQFQVLLEGHLKAETPILRPRQIHSLAVDVTGARQLTLRVLNGGDGYGWDHAVWALARFAEPGAKDPFE